MQDLWISWLSSKNKCKECSPTITTCKIHYQPMHDMTWEEWVECECKYKESLRPKVTHCKNFICKLHYEEWLKLFQCSKEMDFKEKETSLKICRATNDDIKNILREQIDNTDEEIFEYLEKYHVM